MAVVTTKTIFADFFPLLLVQPPIFLLSRGLRGAKTHDLEAKISQRSTLGVWMLP